MAGFTVKSPVPQRLGTSHGGASVVPGPVSQATFGDIGGARQPLRASSAARTAPIRAVQIPSAGTPQGAHVSPGNSVPGLNNTRTATPRPVAVPAQVNNTTIPRSSAVQPSTENAMDFATSEFQRYFGGK